MTDKRFAVDIPADALQSLSKLMLTKEEAKQHMAQCEKILAEAERPKAKVWDFGMLKTGSLHIRDEENLWSCSRTPLDSGGSLVKDSTIHTLGNLKDIVEQQGPIVIGMSVEDARRHKMYLTSCVDSDNVHVRECLTAALERHEEGAGE